MPHSIQVFGLGFIQRDPELWQQPVEGHSVEAIQVRPRQFASPNAIH
jgi:hypothetical protein